ncbi:hypothetical protein FF124_15840 [Martelella lutilitoris]|uniref:Uncharacterized protein n=1 Tax=Martelella lutilitoris TaxID=2583532 RepID=A0A5C4JNX1_9HYPH|nr:hypothetical protein [Martelella lutilitoris]TNB47017.1 hypothetical protein FF124_15840 [Martelella lutilitoris]
MFKTMHALRIALATGLLIAFQTGGAIAADCAAAAAAVVRSTGGELLSAVPAQGGNSCQVTVIIPAKDGNMPRKITQTVPAS